MFFYKPKVKAERFQELRPLVQFRLDWQKFMSLDLNLIEMNGDKGWASIYMDYLKLTTKLFDEGFYQGDKPKKADERTVKDNLKNRAYLLSLPRYYEAMIEGIGTERGLFNEKVWRNPIYRRRIKKIHERIEPYLEREREIQNFLGKENA